MTKYELLFFFFIIFGAGISCLTESRALHRQGRIPDSIDIGFALLFGAIAGGVVAAAFVAAHRYVSN